MFDAATTRTDFNTFKQIISDVLIAVPDEAWARKTGTREKDWTLHQTLAHVVSIAQVFAQATDAAATNIPLETRCLQQREDLAAWNANEIARLSKIPPNALAIRLRQLLDKAVMQAHNYNSAQLQQTVWLPAYNRPAPAMNYIDWQLSHAGVVHAFQLTHALALPPLWTRYPAEMSMRMVDRYLRHFSYAYWPQYGSGQQIINFNIVGSGEWHLIAAEDGGASVAGAHSAPTYTLTFDSAANLFSLFTRHRSIKDVLQSGSVQFSHDWRAVMSLFRLFSPSPPK